MTGPEFGDLVLVPFPFTDQSTTKRRPAVEDRAALRRVLAEILGA